MLVQTSHIMPDNSLPKPVPPAGVKVTQPQSAQPQPASTSNQPPQPKPAQTMPPSARVEGNQGGQPSPAQPKPPVQPQVSSQPQSQKKPTQGNLVKKKSSLAESPQLNSSGGGAGQKSADEKKAKLANVKSSPFKYIPYVLGMLLLIGAGFFVWNRFFRQSRQSVSEGIVETQDTPTTRKQVPAEQITLNYWGLWEPTNVLDDVLADFEEQNQGVEVNYTKQSHRDFRERLQTALSSGNGPDIFRYHASWVPMLSGELAPIPQTVMTASEYQETFYPVASKMLSYNGQLVGIPLMYEGLGLYYNQELLDAANAEVPETWAELKTLANQLTVQQGGQVQQSGLAIGNASNVEHFSDILALLMLQNGADLNNPTGQEAQDALIFYTNFIKQDNVWSDKLPSSTVAFARGDVAMIFAPSWRALEILEMNPELNFGVAPVPKLGDQRKAWASFWAEGVSNKSDQQEMAWKLLSYLSSKEVQQRLYSNQSQTRPFGEIYSRKDLADELAGDKILSAYVEDAPVAEGWYLSSSTHDNGINDLIIKHYRDAVNAVLEGTDAEEALAVVAQGTRQILRQYGLGSTN